MNRITAIGRLTADPDTRTTNDGTPVTSFRLAIPRPGSHDGAVFVTVTSFGRVAAAVAEFLARGRRVAVDGRLDQQEWVDADGARHERHGIVADAVEFLDAPDRAAEPPAPVPA